ncbi:MAG: hypothetical protein JO336_16200 [Acidobacteriia bacterium]|nr:hypothetical protein [Terriglobia bacterium]MBV8905064.1 hypothetical protein [Terriglobia bacterium]
MKAFRMSHAAAAVCGIALAAAGLAILSWGPVRVHAQNAKARTADGKPDFSGIYEWPKAASGERCRCSATIFDKTLFPPLKPGGEPLYEPPNGDPRHDEPRNFCMPAGFPSGMLSANAVQFVQNKNYLVIVHEFQRMTRVIPLDGRPHREGLEPMFYGDPVGHWEGDTLVIDTTNFKRWGLDDYYYSNPKEYRMHSDALHTTERIRWKDDKTLVYELTLDDPKEFTKPWSQTFTMAAKPEWDKIGLFEYVCEENNRCPGGKCQSVP